MPRYKPTDEETEALKAKGWTVDNEGWWWPVGELGYGRTYKEAVKEQDKRDRSATRQTVQDKEINE